MDVKSTPFKQIDREYIITSKELKEKLGIKGKITDIGLYEGRSPNDITNNVSADTDNWRINTKKKNQLNENGN